jgi:hypothetical protein
MKDFVAFDRMWGCLAIWFAMDFVWLVANPSLPNWLQIDAIRWIDRDFCIGFFVGWMWLFSRTPIPLQDRGQP